MNNQYFHSTYLCLIMVTMIIMDGCIAPLNINQGIRARDGFQYVPLSVNNVVLEFPSDYWFHDLEDDLMSVIHEDFLDGLERDHQRKKVVIQFAGHTTVTPYIYTIGMLYPSDDPNAQSAVKLATELSDQLKQEYSAFNIEASPLDTKAGTFQRIIYELPNPFLKTHTQHAEYIGTIGNNLLRIIFCTTDHQPQPMMRESAKIIKNISMEWHSE